MLFIERVRDLKITLSANISSIIGSRKPHDLKETSLQHNMFPALPTGTTVATLTFQHQSLNSSSAAERGLMIQVNDLSMLYIFRHLFIDMSKYDVLDN